MILNEYQNQVIKDLQGYLNHLGEHNGNMITAFQSYWRDVGITGVHYNNHIAHCPHVCLKVPTAGGKTFIAINAIQPIFEFMQHYISDKFKLVLWLVPSKSILQQTAQALKNPDHPYHLCLSGLFNGRINIFEREEVLSGAGFNPDSIRDSLNIILMSFDALKSTNKDNRRAFKENGALANFAEFQDTSQDLADFDSTSLMNTLRRMRPVIIVDESHNANTKLSTDMLNHLNPSFVLDLTATPKENSNIISYVNATALVKQNMVKLPVIVYNKEDEQSVFIEAKVLRERLEQRAIEQQNQGGDYIRPIVLLQAESKNNQDSTDYEKVRQTLIDLAIPREQIKIKTANIDELKGIDLLSPDCEVRYIITINALKEGWDCSFAYILATFANRSSETDVTQLLGRILRKPYARKQIELPLECSYVITASKKFSDTLAQLSKSLEIIGFGAKDFRVPDEIEESNTEQPTYNNTFDLTAQQVIDSPVVQTNQISCENEVLTRSTEPLTKPVDFEKISHITQDYQQNAQQQDLDDMNHHEIAQQKGINQNIYYMQEEFKAQVAALSIPQFVMTGIHGDFFDTDTQILKREYLLTDFRLANQDANLDIGNIESSIWELNVREIKKWQDDKHTDTQLFQDVLRTKDIQDLIQQVAVMSDASQIKQIENSIFNCYTKKAFYPVDDADLRGFIRRVIESLSREQRLLCLKYLANTAFKFKEKINSLMNQHASQTFKKYVDVGKISTAPIFKLKNSVVITEPLNLPLDRSLYEKEDSANSLEKGFLMKLMKKENILWWHRNLSRGKGFAINGYLNQHYPDFIIMTKNKYLILLETKGNDRDGSDSQYKIKLGEAWKNQANMLSYQTGYKYSYFMVFEKETNLEHAYTISQVLDMIGEM